MNRVSVAMGPKLLNFHSASGIATVFGSSVSRYTRRSLIVISATFGAFQGNDNAYAFFACHSLS